MNNTEPGAADATEETRRIAEIEALADPPDWRSLHDAQDGYADLARNHVPWLIERLRELAAERDAAQSAADALLQQLATRSAQRDAAAAGERRAREALEESFIKGMEEAARMVEATEKPGPGGIDITGGIPASVYIGIGRCSYDDEYAVAKDAAETVRDEAQSWILMVAADRRAALAARDGTTAEENP